MSPSTRRVSLRPDPALFATTTVLVAAGFAVRPLWVVATVAGLAAATAWLAASVRRGEPSVDVVAVLALVGTLAVDEPLAGAVIAWMLATGRMLEDRAQARAQRELTLLVERAPRTARRRTGPSGAAAGGAPATDTGGAGTEEAGIEEAGIEEVPVEAVRRGDILLVGPGEVVPVDGRTLDAATLDESALTGEPLPVEHDAGDEVPSGAVNTGSPFGLIASTGAEESTYARIVRLVEQARAGGAPFVRTADRFAVVFVPLALGLAGAAWLLSGDPVRAVAVLVVATPCPLLLAVPIAIVAGLSRAARLGVVVKGGAALERLASGHVLLLDKTGTLTRGRPVVRDVVLADPPAPGVPDTDTLLRLAAGVDQVSPHVLADAVVSAARGRGIVPPLPTEVTEHHGRGIEGIVDHRAVRVGRAGWVVGEPGPDEPVWARRLRRRVGLDGATAVLVSVDGTAAGGLVMEDPLRPDAPRTVRSLRRAGFERVVLVTGDRAEVAGAVGRVVGVDAVHAEQSPEGKLDVLRAEAEHGPTVMVGDGVNDAPALAAADVGVALSARGLTAAGETADIVLTVDRVDRLGAAVAVAVRSRRTAQQAAVVGMGLSLVAMGAAAAGLLPPTAGALLQEVIDVLAIGLALRALLPGRSTGPVMRPEEAALMAAVHAEHQSVRAVVEQVRVVADRLADTDDLEPARALLVRLESELVPHELAEEERLYPLVARLLGGDDPTGAMSRSHAEIVHQVERLHRMLEPDGTGTGGPAPEEPGPEDLADPLEVRRLLHGLHAVLALHDAQEEEGMFSLLPS